MVKDSFLPIFHKKKKLKSDFQLLDLLDLEI